jgi:protein involved in polysaccharide export with SLBB domain
MRLIPGCSLFLALALAVGELHAQSIPRALPAKPAVGATPIYPALPAKPAPASPVAIPRAEPAGEGVVFRSGDGFELRLSGMPAENAVDFAQQFTIGGDGFINIPLAGQIRATGLTQSQLERSIERSLVEQKYFTHPTAIINVAPQARFVTIGGQVRAPQRMVWSADLTLNAAISAAGGPADFAGNKIKLVRGTKVTIINKKDLLKNPHLDPKLMPGDQVELL